MKQQHFFETTIWINTCCGEMVVDEKQLYCAYYTKSDPIVQYMVRTLRLQPSMKALEPAVGDGVLVDALLDKAPITIDAYELNPKAVDQLREKYRGNARVNIYNSDTLFDSDLDFSASIGGSYDLVIANPPYGAWQEPEKRKRLKKPTQGFTLKKLIHYFYIDVWVC